MAMDIDGPLARSKAGHLYILTTMDYCTKYPEAVPLKRTDSITIAEALMMIFSRSGVPTKLLLDCRANLTSQLKDEFKKLLGIASFRKSPYYLQTDEMLERFHAAKKAML